jgi:hypothetical protein
MLINTMGIENADSFMFGDRPDVFSWDTNNAALATLPNSGSYVAPTIQGTGLAQKFATTTNNMVNPANVTKDASTGGVTAGMTTAQALAYLNSDQYKETLNTQGQISQGTTTLHVDSTPVIKLNTTPAETVSVNANSISHVGETQIGDGIWQDVAGATASHVGQTELANGTWLDDVIKEGSQATGGVTQQTTSLTVNTATPEQVAAASKNINQVFTLNSDGTASIKAGMLPTDADMAAFPF